ncbi:MAG: ATP-binding protein [Thermoplasmata archaeon]|nr:ATP-binding protein [Thermoplasmata archaeon]
MENQTEEWKRDWKQGYLKEICGMANTEGGVLKIGIEDDGKIIGVKDPEGTMKSISDTIPQTLGIIPTVEYDENTGTISIIVEKADIPVDYDGRFYIRIGNTTQIAKGRAFDRLVQRRSETDWIDQPVVGLTYADLDNDAIEFFKTRSTKAGLIDERNLTCSNDELLHRLKLSDGKNITRAGALLFHPHPEDIIQGSFTKVGKFDSDLVSQDIVSGPLATRLDRIIDLLYTKYISRHISYEGVNRVETSPYPDKSLRESLVNALVHNDYSARNPVTIMIGDDVLSIHDNGGLPTGWSLDVLLGKHRSKPWNPTLADIFFRMGYVESWGRGIERIIDGYKGTDSKPPVFEASDYHFLVTMSPISFESPVKPVVTYEDLASQVCKIISAMGEASFKEICNGIDVNNRDNTVRRIIKELESKGIVEMTLPDTPRSRNQKYRMTK